MSLFKWNQIRAELFLFKNGKLYWEHPVFDNLLSQKLKIQVKVPITVITCILSYLDWQ